MAIQFSGGVAHKHHRNSHKHCKYEDLTEAMSYLDSRDDEDFDRTSLKT